MSYTQTLFISSLILLTHCAPKQTSKSNEDFAIKDSVIADYSNDNFERYKEKLAALPRVAASSLQGLIIFHEEFVNDNHSDNDKALRSYLQYQSRLIDSLNTELMNGEKYAKVGSLVWADTSLYEEEGKIYMKELEKNGLVLQFTEGTAYIDRDPKIIGSYFFEHLTEGTQEFYSQFEKETIEVFSEDGGINISIQALADRLGFWDRFNAKYRDHLFRDEAQGRRNTYLYYFLSGMDNTPAFDYDSRKINEEFINAYRYYLKSYSSSVSATVIKNYLSILHASEYQRSEEVEAFIKKYQ